MAEVESKNKTFCILCVS